MQLLHRSFQSIGASRAFSIGNVVNKRGIATFQEIQLNLADGSQLAGQRWTPTAPTEEITRNILCLHGWLDNCRSFYHLAPTLASTLNANVVALDLPGHGRSSHKSIEAPPTILPEFTYYISEAVDCLREEEHFVPSLTSPEKPHEPFTLVGHSMGAGISSWYAACFPEEIDQLVMLDGVGFMPGKAKDTPKQVRRHVERRKAATTHAYRNKPPKMYPTLHDAIERRIQTARDAPGSQDMSYEASKEIVLRGTHMDSMDPSMSTKDIDPTKLGPVRFRHDSRFAWPSLIYTTKDQSEAIFETLAEHQIDTCVLMAEHGWPFGNLVKERIHDRLAPREFHVLPGSHHFHADPDSYDAVTDVIVDFLKSTAVTEGFAL